VFDEKDVVAREMADERKEEEEKQALEGTASVPGLSTTYIEL